VSLESPACTHTPCNPVNTNTPSASFTLRIGLAMLPDILSAILTPVLLHKQSLHPVYALTQALVIFCLYPSALSMNLISAYSDETRYDYMDSWQALCWAEMGVQGVLAVLWGVLVGCACVAVHGWRGSKRREEVKGELFGLDEGREEG
jgi:hypothetical protein